MTSAALHTDPAPRVLNVTAHAIPDTEPPYDETDLDDEEDDADTERATASRIADGTASRGADGTASHTERPITDGTASHTEWPITDGTERRIADGTVRRRVVDASASGTDGTASRDADGTTGGAASGTAGRRPRLPPCPAEPPPPPVLRLLPSPDDAEPDPESFDAVRSTRDELEDPVPRAAMLARALLETLAGVRPVGQLTRWVSPEVLVLLQSMVANRAAHPAPTAIRRVLVSEPGPGIAEVTAIVDRGPRVEAFALRMDGLDGRWLVTAFLRA